MPTKFYWHDAATTDTGTLPGAGSISGVSITTSAVGADTNRSMDASIGAGQTSAALTTTADTLDRFYFFRRFLTGPLAAQTISAQTITIRMAATEANANSDMFENGALSLIAWRPSTGNYISGVLSTSRLGLFSLTEPGTTQTAITGSVVSTARTLSAGDILVLEVISEQTQAMGTAYLNTIFYDGTTEGSTTNNAAHIEFTNDVALFVAAGVETRDPWPALQAVKTGSLW